MNFNDLTLDVQKKIKDKIGEDFDYSKLYVEIVHFYGTKDSKKLLVSKMISSFFSKIGLSDSKVDLVYNKLIVEGLMNASDKKVKMKKEELVYFIITPFLVETISINEFQKFMNEEYYDECVDYYEKFLYTESLQYSLFTKITNDFRLYKSKNKEKNISDFVCDIFSKYLYLIDENMDTQVREGIIKILLYKVLQKSNTISKVQREANL